MKDKYIILRAITFWLYNEGRLFKRNEEPVKYRSDMEEFLGFGMECLNRMTETELTETEQRFDVVIKTFKELQNASQNYH